MKTTGNKVSKGTKSGSPNKNRPEIRDDMDSRQSKEEGYKGDKSKKGDKKKKEKK